MKTTSSAVNGAPSEKTTPWRRCEGVGPPSGPSVHLVASAGSMLLGPLIELHQAGVEQQGQEGRRADRSAAKRLKDRGSARMAATTGRAGTADGVGDVLRRAEERARRRDDEHDEAAEQQSTCRGHKEHSRFERTSYTHVGQPASLGPSVSR